MMHLKQIRGFPKLGGQVVMCHPAPAATTIVFCQNLAHSAHPSLTPLQMVGSMVGCANKDLWALCAPIFIIVVYCKTASSYFLGGKE